MKPRKKRRISAKISEQNLVLLVIPTSGEPGLITVSRQAVFKVMCEAPLLVFTQPTVQINVISHEDVANNHACMTAKSILDAYPSRLFYIPIANFG